MAFLKGLPAALLLLILLAGSAYSSEQTEPDLDALLEDVESRLASGSDDLQLIFIHGMLLAEQGRFREAADAFRNMLSRDPGLLRPRLELARTLMHSRDFDGARYHFEQVLAHELPDPVRRNVLHLLAFIREESPSFSWTMELVFDSNPKQATSSREVEIDGMVFRLSDDARANSETGLRFVLDGRVPLGDPALWFARGHIEHQEFDGKELDFSYLQLAGGRHFRLENQTVTLEAGYHWSLYQHTQLYHGVLWTAGYYRSLRPDLSMRLNLSGLQLNYFDYTHLDGWQHTPSATLIYAASPKTRWHAEMGYIINRAGESSYSFDQPYVNLRYVREWTGGWITGAGVKTSWIEYKDIDPFFRETRREREIRLEADLLNRHIRFWRLSPRLLVGYAERDSNLDFYTWERSYVRVGMTAEF